MTVKMVVVKLASIMDWFWKHERLINPRIDPRPTKITHDQVLLVSLIKTLVAPECSQ